MEHGTEEGDRDLDDSFVWKRCAVGGALDGASKAGDKVVDGCVGMITVACAAHGSWVECQEF